jgi:hypothetical protein
MKRIISALGLMYLSACTIQPAGQSLINGDEPQCIGSVELNAQVAQLFAVSDDQQMLQRALGGLNLESYAKVRYINLNRGRLCPCIVPGTVLIQAVKWGAGGRLINQPGRSVYTATIMKSVISGHR